jgi:Flp pilus assembly protein TadB
MNRWSPEDDGYEKTSRDQSRSRQPRSDQAGYDQPRSDQREHGQPRSDQREHGQPRYEQPQSSQPRYDQTTYDRPRYHQSGALAALSTRPGLKWVGLFLAWALVTWLLEVIHLGWLVWPLMVALIGYVVVEILRVTPSRRRRAR